MIEQESKKVSYSSVVLSQVMLPEDTNPVGNVHGGTIMKIIDNAAYVVASRHARKNTVTASIDKIDFHNPVFLGDLLILKASINWVGRSSMEIGVRVEAENLKTGEIRHTSSAYLTFVALDDNGKPCLVPQLILETEDEIRRNKEANCRLKTRKNEKCNVEL
jgi:acyl-CoA hydrolase